MLIPKTELQISDGAGCDLDKLGCQKSNHDCEVSTRFDYQKLMEALFDFDTIGFSIRFPYPL
jgi:hypothetical protein